MAEIRKARRAPGANFTDSSITYLDLLPHIDPCPLNYQEWINVGMAIKSAGGTVETWTEWSARDRSRFHDGECAAKWASFNGNGINLGTLVFLAKENGWMPPRPPTDNRAIGWNCTINEADTVLTAPTQAPANEIITYLETLFRPEERVRIVTESYMKDGRRCLTTGETRYVHEFIDTLRLFPDPEQVIGKYDHDIGAWIAINPLDGKGISAKNVTAYRHALVESDTMPIDEQAALYKELQLPCAALVHSGGKSLHALVKVDADDAGQYRERVAFLHKVCNEHGLEVDGSNKDAGRLSRLPAIQRGEGRQYLVATNTGKASWDEWVKHIEGVQEPEYTWMPVDVAACPPPAAPIFRNGPKPGDFGLVIGGDGCGKGWILLDLLVSCALGRRLNIETISHEGEPFKVAYVGYEDDGPELKERLNKICFTAAVNPGEWVEAQRAGYLNFFCRIDDDLPELATQRKNDLPIPTAAFSALEAFITGAGIKLAVIDTLSAAAGLQNEDNASLNAFSKALRRMARRTGCTLLLVHHTAKATRGAMDHTSSRGGGSLPGNGRWGLNIVIPDEKNFDSLEMGVTKTSYGKRLTGIKLVRESDGVIRELSRDEIAYQRTVLEDKVLTFMKDYAGAPINANAIANGKARELIEAAQDRPGEVARAVKRLVESGRLMLKPGAVGKKTVQFLALPDSEKDEYASQNEEEK